MMNAINLLGASAAVLGAAGMNVVILAGRQTLTSPLVDDEGTEWPVLIALIFIALIDLAVIASGIAIAMFDASVMGGANG